MNKNLIVIGIQDENLLLLQRQLESVFIEHVNIDAITLKDFNYKSISSNDIILLSAQSILEIVKPLLPKSCVCIVAKRIVNVVNMKELLSLQGNKKFLVVNDNELDTLQATESIRSILPQHTYVPYLTNRQVPTDTDFVVTPGESQLIPNELPKIIDIGARVISIDTLIELNTIFNLQIDPTTLTQLYIKSMVVLSKDNTMHQTVSIDDKNLYRTFDDFTTNSSNIQTTIRIAKKIARTEKTVHIEGEVGTGKRMFAEMIHNHSTFSSHPIYVYNCSDKEPELIKSELFDDEKGLINSATSGTIFIRNIDKLPYSLQGDLLEAIKYSSTNNIRLITSSSKNLEDLIKNDILRTEIYAHISPYTLRLINLAERKEDIEELIIGFKEKLNKVNMNFSESVMRAFYQYPWPGNVSELFNVVSYCVCLNTNTIELDSLPIFFKGNQNESKEKININSIVEKIEEHGFLNESINILNILQAGKNKNESYGRAKIKTFLLDHGCMLTDQQLRLRIEILRNLNLLNVRKGRAGTTITNKGEGFLAAYENTQVNVT